jgi:hypothetical protein
VTDERPTRHTQAEARAGSPGGVRGDVRAEPTPCSPRCCLRRHRAPSCGIRILTTEGDGSAHRTLRLLDNLTGACLRASLVDKQPVAPFVWLAVG